MTPGNPPPITFPPDVLAFLRKLEEDDRRDLENRREEIQEQAQAIRQSRAMWMTDRRMGGRLNLEDLKNIEQSQADAESHFGSMLPPIEAELAEAKPDPEAILKDYQELMQMKGIFDLLIKNYFQNANRYRTSAKVHFATLERPNLNAIIQRVPGTEHTVAIFNRGFWHAIEAIATLIAASFDYQARDPLAIRFNPEKASRYTALYSDIQQRFMLGRSVDYTPYLPVSDDEGFLATKELVSVGMQNFVLGHEYAHFLHDHTGSEQPHNLIEVKGISVVVSEPETPAAEPGWYEYHWEDEYEADRTGLDLAVFSAVMALRGNLIGYLLGSEAVFASIYFLYRAESRGNKVFRATSAHPPTWLRIEMIASTMLYQLRSMGPEFEQRARYRMNEIVKCIDYFFDNPAALSIFYHSRTEHAERNFQDVVFHALFDVETHQNALRMTPQQAADQLKVLHSKLKTMAEKGAYDRKMVKIEEGVLAFYAYQAFDPMHYDSTTTPEESAQIVENCINMITRNMDAQEKLFRKYAPSGDK